MSLDSLLLLDLWHLPLHPERRLSSLTLDLRGLDILESGVVGLAAEGVALELEGLFVIDLGLGSRGSVEFALELGAVAQDVLSRGAGGFFFVLVVEGHCAGR